MKRRFIATVKQTNQKKPTQHHALGFDVASIKCFRFAANKYKCQSVSKSNWMGKAWKRGRERKPSEDRISVAGDSLYKFHTPLCSLG
jgi:hypothetical protein